MPDRNYVGEVLSRGFIQTLGCDSEEPNHLRARAARYRALAETLIDLRVIAVVQACAEELEMDAIADDGALRATWLNATSRSRETH